MPSALEESLWQQITGDTGLPWPQREFRFAAPKRWRFDFAFEPERLAVEVEGGHWLKRSRSHGGGTGFENDCIKYAEAAILGWRIIRVTNNMVADGTALALIQRAIQGEET